MTSSTRNSIIPSAWGQLPDVFRERLGDQVGRQRLMVSEEHMLLVLHSPPKPEDELREGRLFWRVPSGEWRSSHHGPRVDGLHQHLEEYEEQLEQLMSLEERAVDAEGYFEVLERIAPLQRAVSHLHQVLQEARETQTQDRDLILLRDHAYALERRAELLSKNTKNALDFAVVRQAENQAKSSYHMALSAHRLNILAAFFFPMTAISSLMGISYKEVLSGKFSLQEFLGVIAVGVTVGLLITALISRGKRAP